MISAIILHSGKKNLEPTINSLNFSIIDEIIIMSEKTVNSIFPKTKIENSQNSVDFAAARNRGMKLAKNEWVLFVDDDETLVGDFSCLEKNSEVLAFFCRRQDFIWNKKIKHGEHGAWKEVRLMKKTAGKWKGKIHERFHADGEIAEASFFLTHRPYKNLGEMLDKINFYSDLRSNELIAEKTRIHLWQIAVYPLAKFLDNYVVKFGFLDGTAGFVLAAMMSFYSFLVRSKAWMKQKAIS